MEKPNSENEMSVVVEEESFGTIESNDEEPEMEIKVDSPVFSRRAEVPGLNLASITKVQKPLKKEKEARSKSELVEEMNKLKESNDMYKMQYRQIKEKYNELRMKYEKTKRRGSYDKGEMMNTFENVITNHNRVTTINTNNVLLTYNKNDEPVIYRNR